MTLARAASRVALLAVMLLVAMTLWGLGNQRHAQAQVPVSGEDINCGIDEDNGSPIPDFCDDEGDGEEQNSPQDPIDPPVDGGDINCDIYEQNGPPIPDFCDDGDDNNPPPPPPPGDDDDEETTPPPADTSSGGGGGGGGGGGSSKNKGEVLGAATDTSISCDMYLTEFIRFGGTNNPEQVTRLQSFLNTYEGGSLQESGIYDAPTHAAVHAFQQKYASNILAPWGATRSTGFVYLTTRKMVNEIRCERLFPLSAQEAAEIDSYRSRTAGSLPGAAPALAPSFNPDITLPTSDLPAADAEADAPEVETRRGSILDSIRSFFGWIFGR